MSIWVVILTAGLLVLVVSGDLLNGLLAPGPLAKHHGHIADCGDCHVSYHEGTAGWVLAAFAESSTQRDNQQCLECHEHNPDDALAPHTAPPAVLASSSVVVGGEQTLEQTLADTLFTPPHEVVGDGIACATCHAEHQGVHVEQNHMSNQRCQACHDNTFAAFADGHPPFVDYPYQRRTRIVFDHRNHVTRYFPEYNPPRDNILCIDCHVPDTEGRRMTVRSYEETCAACHDGDIAGDDTATGARGIAFLRIPGIDVAELEERGIDIYDWPEYADEPLTPFMRVLIETDPELVDILDQIEDIDLLDLRNASAEQITAVERLAWAVKRQVRNLVMLGVPELAERMAMGLGTTVEEPLLRRLSGLLPPDVANATQQIWFPNLYRELALHVRGAPVPSTRTASDEVATENSAVSVNDDGDILSSDVEVGDILVGDDENTDLFSNADDHGDNILTSDDSGGGDNEETVDLFQAPSQTVAVIPIDEPSDTDHEHLARLGGWYRTYQTLYYRPAGHADPFLRTYLDIAGSAASNSEEPRGLFNELAGEDSPGRCSKCHSIDRQENGGLAMLWSSWQPDFDQGTFTVFSHKKHFSPLKSSGCVACHKLATDKTYLDSFTDFDPTTFTSNFDMLPITVCAECHIPEVAGDNCTTCHRYHDGRFITETMPMPMTDLITQ